MKWWQLALLALILTVAAALRFAGLDWDDYNHYHPDERYIAWVATTIEWPAKWSSAFDPTGSTFNPFYWPEGAASKGIVVPQDSRRSFAYGHVPLYLGVIATRLLERFPAAVTQALPEHWLLTRDVLNGAGAIEFRHLTAVGRAMTAIFDVGTVALVFLLGRRLHGVNAGLLAAAFLALNVMHIQLAHFFTADPLLTFFVVAAVLAMVASLPVRHSAADESRATREKWYLIGAAMFSGLAVGSKSSAALLFIPLAVTLWFSRPFSNQRFMAQLAGLGLIAALTFVVSNPFAVLDWQCGANAPSGADRSLISSISEWRSCYLADMVTQGSMVRGSLDAPFTRQYSGTLPFLYYLEGQARWGMGPALGLLAIVGLGWATWRGIRALVSAGRRSKGDDLWEMPVAAVRPGELVVLAWVVPYFLSISIFFVKFMRYMQPITPFLMVFAAGVSMTVRPRWLRIVLVTTVLAVTALYALGFVNMYRSEHPWVSASRWLFSNAPDGAMIVNEQWDEPLPSSMQVDGVVRRRAEFGADELTWLTGADARDNEQKLAENLDRLARADYITLSSNRVYGVVPRLPERYPLSSQYYARLFDGSLGYDLIFVAGRFPGLSGIHLKPDTFSWPGLDPPEAVRQYLADQTGPGWGRADESYLVYDQPLTMIFANTGRLSAEEMRTKFQR